MRHLLHRLLPLAAAAAFLACDGGTSPPMLHVVSAFSGSNTFTLTADADKAYSDRPITFTARCTTVVNGKGRIRFSAYCDRHPGEIRVESPIIAMLIHDSIPEITIPMAFVANEPIALPIRCRFLQSDVSCFYHGAVIIDSLFVADSNRYFDVNSDVAQPLVEKGHAYLWSLPSKGGVQALYPP